LLEQSKTTRPELALKARAEADRLFAPEVVCSQISLALERLVVGLATNAHAARPLEADPV